MSAPSYEEFFDSWRALRISAQGKTLVPSDPLVKQRAGELSRLALAAGHLGALERAVRPYRDIRAFVVALYVVAELKASSQP